MEIVSNVKILRTKWKNLQCLSSSLVSVKVNESPSIRKEQVRYKTGYGVGPAARVKVDLEQSAEQYLKEKSLKPAKHPGIFHLPKVQLPNKFRDAAENILRHNNLKKVVQNADYLRNYIWSRRLPMDNEQFRDKASKIEEEIRRNDEVLLPFLSEKETIKLNKKREMQILKELRHKVYHWEPIQYTKERALEYLVARSAPEYAILCRIFSEISKRVPDFKPKTLCDFGSGLGTVSWAARSLWASSLLEHLCADLSWEMNELAELLMRGGNKNNDHPIPALFFRQHLPESYKIRYDLVVSAFSLMELPSAKERLTVIDKLWNKTEEFLVVVEPGTIAGFRAVIEARNYILGLDLGKRPHSNCHVFSPCPNSLECPRFSFDTIPCNFPVRYRPLYPFHHNNCETERFCYVVIRRGRPNSEDPAWPRLVEDPMIRTRHVVCRMCTKDATLSEVVLTRAKHSQKLRLIAKRSEWGDLIPFTTEDLNNNQPQQYDNDDKDDEDL